MRVANCVKGSSAVAIYAVLFFDPRGRPGPRRRLPRRRPFFDFVFAVETLPSNDWIAECTSCCTNSRITVSKLFCLGIEFSFPVADTRNARSPAKAVRQPSQLQEKHAGGQAAAARAAQQVAARRHKHEGSRRRPSLGSSPAPGAPTMSTTTGRSAAPLGSSEMTGVERCDHVPTPAVRACSPISLIPPGFDAKRGGQLPEPGHGVSTSPRTSGSRRPVHRDWRGQLQGC
jgi:hypothetical protein